MFTKIKKDNAIKGTHSKLQNKLDNTVINQKWNKTKIHGHVFFFSHHREEESLIFCNKCIFIEFSFANKSMLDIRTEDQVWQCYIVVHNTVVCNTHRET